MSVILAGPAIRQQQARECEAVFASLSGMEVWVGKDWRRFQGLIPVNEFVQWLRRGVGKLLLAASSAITAGLTKMELDATLINRSSRISPEKYASVYECLRFTWPKNRLLGQVDARCG